MENIQLMPCGKTSLEHLAATKARTSASSSKNSQKSRTKPYLYLHLPVENGQRPATWTEMTGALPGESWTPNTTESSNVAVESCLSQILEVNAPEKYRLSAKACLGILRRAERRGKRLPEMLREALEQTAATETSIEVEDDWME